MPTLYAINMQAPPSATQQTLDAEFGKLCATLGEIEFKLLKLHEQKLALVTRISALNELQPSLLLAEKGIVRQLESIIKASYESEKNQKS